MTSDFDAILLLKPFLRKLPSGLPTKVPHPSGYRKVYNGIYTCPPTPSFAPAVPAERSF